MLNIDEINKTILDLEQHDTTYATCEKLAWLYIVRDHIISTPSQTRKISPQLNDSDFLMACSGVDVGELLQVLDEHIQAIRLVYPKEYDSLMRKIREL